MSVLEIHDCKLPFVYGEGSPDFQKLTSQPLYLLCHTAKDFVLKLLENW